MKEESEKLCREYGEKYLHAMKKDDYLKAFKILLTGIKVAHEKKDRESKKVLLSLMRTIGTSVSSEYRMLGTDDQGKHIDSCYMCANHFKKERLIFGIKGAICGKCLRIAHEFILDNPKFLDESS